MQIKKTEDFIKGLLDKMGFDKFVVEVTEKDGDLFAEIISVGNNNVIGYRGETLDAIQYLTSLIVNAKTTSKHKRIIVDSENYRQKREKSLQGYARKMEQKVKKSQRAEKLEPMNPFERRIVHTALQNSEWVTTESEGDEPNRYVVISPTLTLAKTRKTLNFVYRSDKKRK